MTSLPPLWPGGVHPAALAFPEIVGEEFTALVEDIRANGLLNPIIIDDKNVLLDGRNRLRAWVELGNPATTIKRHIHPGDPLDLIVSANVRRRHLTDTQLATLALDLLPQYEARAEERKQQAGKEFHRGRPSEKVGAPGRQPFERAPKATDEAAAAVGTSGRTVQRVKRVADEAPDLVESMRKGELTAKEAERLVKERQRDEEAARALDAQIEEDVEAVLDHLSGVDQSPRLRLIVTNSARYQATLNGFTNDRVYPKHLQESRAQAAAMLTEFREQHYAEVQRNLEAANAAREQREAHEHLVLALSAAQEWLNCNQPFNPGHMTHHIHQPDDIIAILTKVITSIKNAPITEGENHAA